MGDPMELVVGKDIGAICSKCGDVWHVIVALRGDAIAKVQCKQCGGYHRYKPSPDDVVVKPKAKKVSVRATTTKAPAARKTTARKSATRVSSASNAGPLIDPDLDLPVRAYAIAGIYQAGERIEHPKFGQGVVESFPAPDKMNVFFEDGRRTLAFGR